MLDLQQKVVVKVLVWFGMKMMKAFGVLLSSVNLLVQTLLMLSTLNLSHLKVLLMY